MPHIRRTRYMKSSSSKRFVLASFCFPMNVRSASIAFLTWEGFMALSTLFCMGAWILLRVPLLLMKMGNKSIYQVDYYIEFFIFICLTAAVCEEEGSFEMHAFMKAMP